MHNERAEHQDMCRLSRRREVHIGEPARLQPRGCRRGGEPGLRPAGGQEIQPVALRHRVRAVVHRARLHQQLASARLAHPVQIRGGLVVDARITDLSWYLAASPAAVDTIEYARLEGQPEGPQLEARDGWDVDGVEFKAREDFGACVVDWRGLTRNPGA